MNLWSRLEARSLFSVGPDPGQVPFLGRPFDVGQTIEAEYFDTSTRFPLSDGRGDSYADSVDLVRVTDFRPNARVDFRPAYGDGNLQIVWTYAWYEYTVLIPAPGEYEIVQHAAWGNALAGETGRNNAFRIEMESGEIYGNLNALIPSTGGYDQFITTGNGVGGTPRVTLPPGEAILTLNSGGRINYDWLKIVPVDHDVVIPAPVDVAATPARPYCLDLAWDTLWPEQKHGSFTVQRRVQGGGWTTLDSAVWATTFADHAATPGVTYDYRVRANGPDAGSDWSTIVSAAAPRQGDFNFDRQVNFSDLLILAQNYGHGERTFAQGDATGDGTVGFDDLLSFAQSYDVSSSSIAARPTRKVAMALDVVG